MPDPFRVRARGPTRPLLLGAGALAVVVLLVVVRGPVALLAAATMAVIVGLVLSVPTLLSDDGIDWDWLPDRADEVPPEPGIAALHRLLSPTATDTAAPAELHDLVRSIAQDRNQGRVPVEGPLAAYLGGPARRLDLREVESLVAALEDLPTNPSRPRSPQ